MNKLPEVERNWGDLNNLVKISTQSSFLLKAIEWKIFDYLQVAVPAQTVAVYMKSHPGNTELFLNALAGMGVINKENGLFCNTEKTNKFLVSSSPAYLGDFFLLVMEWSKEMEHTIETLVISEQAEHRAKDMLSQEP